MPDSLDREEEKPPSRRMKRYWKIAILANIKDDDHPKPEGVPPDAFADYDHIETIDSLRAALETDGQGHLLVNRGSVATVDTNSRNPVGGAALSQRIGGVLLASRRRESIAIILNDQDERHLEHGCHVQAFVEVSRGRASFPDKIDGDSIAPALLERKSEPGRHGDHGAQVADHADMDNACLVIEVGVVVGAFAPP